MQQAERLAKLFDGQDIAYGSYVIEGEAEPGEKVAGVARTISAPVTIAVWQAHIEGTSVGIIPVKSDGTCKFGAIDIDNYKIDYADILLKLDTLKLPLVPCKSKSGGLHLYLFTSEPVKASQMQLKLAEFAAAMGVAVDSKGKHVEIFPKQKKSDAKTPGNWINMPYCKGTRLGIGPDGKDIEDLDQWLDYAYNKCVTAKEFSQLGVQAVRLCNGEAPPCAEIMATSGIPAGQRNDGLFHLGLVAKRFQPIGWQQLLEDWNREFLDPPLNSKEVSTLISSLEKKDYHYACDKDPMRSFCNRQLCTQRLYGVAQDTTLLDVRSVFKIDSDPPIFVIEIGDKQIRVSPDDLYSQSKFGAICLSKLNQMPARMKQELWTKFWNEKLASVVIIDIPVEYSPEGSMFEKLREYLDPKRHTDILSEFTGQKVYKENGSLHFKLSSFMDWLENSKWRELDRNQIIAALQNNRDFVIGKRLYTGNNHKLRVIEVLPEFFGDKPSKNVSDELDLSKLL